MRKFTELIILSSVLILSSMTSLSKNGNIHPWEVKDLAEEVDGKNHFFSPDYILLKEDINRIKYSGEWLKDVKIDLKCILINSISDNYRLKTSVKKDIERFTNDLAFVINRNKENDKNSLIILISVKDRQIRIRTGSEVAEKISSATLAEIIQGVSIKFKNDDYVNGIVQIYDQLYYSFKWGNSIYFSVLFMVLLIVLAFIAFGIYKYYSKIYIDPEGLERLKRLKKQLEKNKPKKVFLDTTCVICLNEFISEDSTLHIHDKEKDIKLVNETADSARREDLPNVTDLACGHRFHDDCIRQWMKKENTCPTCRGNIDGSENDETFSKGLVNIQAVYFPSINDVNIMFLADSLSWTLPSNNNIDISVGNVGNNSMWDIAGGMSITVGGATGNW